MSAITQEKLLYLIDLISDLKTLNELIIRAMNQFNPT